MLIGPEVLLPWGLVLYTFIGCIVLVIIAELWWKCMKHFPEDDHAYSEGNDFVIESDLDDAHGKGK
jgi:hypothetical protein